MALRLKSDWWGTRPVVQDVEDLPFPGAGRTGERFQRFADLARRDLVLARLAEGHADAVAIRAELGDTDPADTDPADTDPADTDPADTDPADTGPADTGPADTGGRRWGVWAAAPSSLKASRSDSGWTVSGDRPWCSGAAECTHALVTAAAPDGIRLFAVEVREPWATPLDGTWPAVGMAGSDSRTVRFTDAPARPLGGVGAYVDRPGFWHGGVGVAACWYGGAVGVADTLLAAARKRELSPHAMAHLGAVDVHLHAARLALREAAEQIDADPTANAEQLAVRVRATVESAATRVLEHVGRALGAGPLGQDEAHAHRVADLTVYLRQSHAEADLAHLGVLVRENQPAW